MINSHFSITETQAYMTKRPQELSKVEHAIIDIKRILYTEWIMIIFKQLTYRDIDALSTTCHYFEDLTNSIVPQKVLRVGSRFGLLLLKQQSHILHKINAYLNSEYDKEYIQRIRRVKRLVQDIRLLSKMEPVNMQLPLVIPEEEFIPEEFSVKRTFNNFPFYFRSQRIQRQALIALRITFERTNQRHDREYSTQLQVMQDTLICSMSYTQQQEILASFRQTRHLVHEPMNACLKLENWNLCYIWQEDHFIHKLLETNEKPKDFFLPKYISVTRRMPALARRGEVIREECYYQSREPAKAPSWFYPYRLKHAIYKTILSGIDQFSLSLSTHLTRTDKESSDSLPDSGASIDMDNSLTPIEKYHVSFF